MMHHLMQDEDEASHRTARACRASSCRIHPRTGLAQRVPGKDAASSPITKEPPHHPAGVARSHQAHARARRSLTASMPFHVHFVPFPFRTRCMSMVHGPSVGRRWAVVDGRGAMRCPCSTGPPQGVRAPGRAPGPNKGQGQRISLGVCNLVVAVRVCMTDMRMWEWVLARFPLLTISPLRSELFFSSCSWPTPAAGSMVMAMAGVEPVCSP